MDNDDASALIELVQLLKLCSAEDRRNIQHELVTALGCEDIVDVFDKLLPHVPLPSAPDEGALH